MICLFCKCPLELVEPMECSSIYGVCDLCAREHMTVENSDTIEIEGEEDWIDTPIEDREAA